MALNLSVWGCGVASAMFVEKGTHVGLSLHLPHEPVPLAVDLARVRWSAGGRFGVEFLTMSSQARSRLRRYLLALGTTATRARPLSADHHDVR